MSDTTTAAGDGPAAATAVGGITRLLVANRGEIAVRVARTARDLGITTVMVHSDDDAHSPHVRAGDEAVALAGTGPAAYLDAAQVVDAAVRLGCDAVHPGYGFLSEQAAFARACQAAGLVFVGPQPEVLDAFGDKAAGRAVAQRAGVPVLRGTAGATSLADAQAFLASLGPRGAVMVKAVAGGGGRGMRLVAAPEGLPEAWERCRSEAAAAFGIADVYVEEALLQARHVEVQVAGDGTGAVVHLGERECSLQRRHQKVVELAPAPGLPAEVRAQVHDAAVRLAAAVRLRNLATVEFLVAVRADGAATVAFIEANARLQVEHTVTEAVLGLDLVALQVHLAAGATVGALGLDHPDVARPRGAAVQLRVNLETVQPDGTVRPTAGTVTVFEPPTGPGVRVDTFVTTGYRTSTLYDPLLAKVIVHHPAGHEAALARAARAVGELRVEGVGTNAAFLQRVVAHPDVTAGRVHTGWLEEHLVALAPPPADGAVAGAAVGAVVDRVDPLAVLDLGRAARDARATVHPDGTVGAVVADEEGTATVRTPLQGTVVAVSVAEGDEVRAGQQVAVLEAMKMEHVLAAPVAGVVRRVLVAPGAIVPEGQPVVVVEAADVAAESAADVEEVDLDEIRPDLAEVRERHAVGRDERRPQAVAKRRATGQRTARENVDDLCDPGSFTEYAPLVVAPQRRRRSLDDLIVNTPADGMVAGLGRVNGHLFGDDVARVVAMSYDYTVLAGTQGGQNHRKKDRLFELAEKWRLPVVLFAEGGGGRPGDTDGIGGSGLDCLAFMLFGRLSGLVPLVGITSGYCFAGNAALLGCCDVVIATKGSNIGMGGPAMIEGGGLGVFRPDEVGPVDVQVANGVVDVLVDDEAEAVRVAKQYLSYFQGPVADWSAADQRLLRRAVPEHRLRVYDVRTVIHLMADEGSVLELRRGFGPGMVTALARVEGRPIGIVANDPTHLAGAIDADGADKAARFMALCDAFDIPVLFLCDTPGIMVGPEAEKQGTVRHAARLFVVGGSLTVPFFTIVLRKGYGLGAQAMAGGSFKAGVFTVAWPTGEFGGMGLEGAVKLGYRKELAAVEDPHERRALFDQMVARMYEHGKALNTASTFEIDEVIDPADSRRWISAALRSVPPPPQRTHKKRPCVDTW